MDPRQRKGLEISGQQPIKHDNGAWIVPSQTNRKKSYRVRFGPDEFSCSCPHFELIEPEFCKHIYAVRYFLEEQGNLPSPIPRSPQAKKYPRNWPVYNEAKANEPPKFRRLLYDLCRALPNVEPGKKGGRPRIPTSDLAYAAITKVYLGESGRKLADHLKQAHEAGYITQIPKPSTVLNFFGDPASADILRILVGQSCLPLSEIETKFPVDSTTFQLSRFDRWYDQKRQKAMEEKSTVKCHLICGARTNVIAWATVTSGTDADAPEFPHLIHHAAKRFRILEVMADASYSAQSNYTAADKVGATPYIAFREGSTGWAGGLFQRMFSYYQLQRQEFRERYSLRNNAESTASMLKKRFEGSLSFRGEQAIENEVLSMVVVHNICVVIQSTFCLGIEAEFWANGDTG